MKVYVVMFDRDIIFGVYSSEDIANKIIQKNMKEMELKENYFEIFEEMVDKDDCFLDCFRP